VGITKGAGIILGVIGLGLGVGGMKIGSGENEAIGRLEGGEGQPTGSKATVDGKQLWESRSVLTIDGNVFQKTLYQTDNGASVKYILTTPTGRIEGVWEEGGWKDRVVRDELSGVRTALYVLALLALGIGLGLFLFASNPRDAPAGKPR
jgi:hypothetical protein